MGLQNIRPFVGLTNEQFKKTNFLSREAGSVTLPSWLNFQRLSPVNVQTSATTMQAIATNIACVFYDGVIKGLLMEEKRTNYISNINTTASYASWNNDSGTGTYSAGQSDPFGGTNAVLIGGGANSYARYIGVTIPAASPISISNWVKTATHACISITGTGGANAVNADTSNVWKKYQYSIASLNPGQNYALGDSRTGINTDNTATSGYYSAPQAEIGLYPTSWINGALTVRNSSTLTSLITNSNSFQITLQDVKYCSLAQATDNPYIISNYSSDQTLAIWTDKSTGYIKIQVGAVVVTTTIQSSFVYGDILQASIIASTNGSNSLVSITVTKNFVNIGSYNCNFTTAINQVSKKLIIGSDYLGAHQFCGYLQKISGTFDGDVTDGYPDYLDFSLGSRGIVTLPSSALTFTCASTRTCQTSATTQIEGIGTNVICLNINGLQHEANSSNNVPYSEAFASWVNGGTLNSTTILDPVGTTTGCDITGTGGGAGGMYSGGIYGLMGAKTTITMSSWTKGADGTSKSGIGLANTSAAPIIQNVEQAPISTTWHKQTATYLGTNPSASYVLLNDQRTTGVTTPCRGDYAKIQVEPLPFATSYIKVPGTTAMTRTASNITKAIPNDSDLIFDIEWVASHAPTIGWEAQSNSLQVIISGNNGYIATSTGTGKIRIYNGYSATDTVGTATWVGGDIVRLVAQTFYSLKQVKLTIYVNGSIILNETVTMNENLAFLGFSSNILSNPGGSYHCSPNSVHHILIKPRTTTYPLLTQPGNFGTLLAAWDARYGIASSGGVVDSWTPYLGDSSIILSGTGVQRPTYVANRGDGRPELSFDGVANVLTATAASLQTIPLNQVSVIIAMSRFTAGKYAITLNQGVGGTNSHFKLYNWITNTVFENGTPYNVNITQSDVRQGVVLTRNGTTQRIFTSQSGSVVSATVGTGLAVAVDTLRLASTSGSDFGAGKISAIWLYKSSLLPGGELQAVAAMNSTSYYPVL
jgi:hypothetical protein